jgi:hypothetical protein
MQFMTLITHSAEGGETALTSGTRKDLSVIDRALASKEKRELAKAALHIAARIVEQALESAEEETPLDKAEWEILDHLGIDVENDMSDADFYKSGLVLEGIARETIVTAKAIPLAEAALRMGVSDARLRQRIAAGSLMAVHRPRGRGWLIPTFQLTDTGEVPHLGRALLAAGRPVSAQAMDRLFRTPRDDLQGHTPRDWLIAGHDPAIIERILGAL